MHMPVDVCESKLKTNYLDIGVLVVNEKLTLIQGTFMINIGRVRFFRIKVKKKNIFWTYWFSVKEKTPFIRELCQ